MADDATCGAPSLWDGITCQDPPHGGQGNHRAEDDRSSYVWTTAGVEAAKDGRCPACLRWVCACPCRCDMCRCRR